MLRHLIMMAVTALIMSGSPILLFGSSAPSVGSMAPDFTLPDLDGKLHSLSDYRGKKVVLMSWASW